MNTNLSKLMSTSFKRTKHATTKLFSLLALLLILGVNGVMGQSPQTFTTTGTWTCPAGVTSVQVECWGAGGAGGSAVGNTTNSRRATAGGGAGGAYAKSTINVVPNTVYTVTVGTGATASNSNGVSVAGGDSWFSSSTTIIAKGGAGANSLVCTSSSDLTSTGGAGTTTGSIGTVVYKGGDGASGTSPSGAGYSGGGGSSAGTASDGTSATNYVAAAAVTGGGIGGTGRSSNGGNGSAPASGVGGGGGGAWAAGSATQRTGGSGRNGQVILTWSASPPTISLSSPSQIAAANVNQGTTSHILSNFQAAVTVANATLNSIAVVTGGTYSTSSHVSGYKLMYNGTSNTFGSAVQIGTTQSSVASAGTVTFSSLSQSITSGNTGYFWVTADISGSATASQTVNIAANPTLTFASGTPSGSISKGGDQTFVAVTPNIALSAPSSSTADFTVGTTNNQLYRFDLAVTTANASLSGVTITTAGTYAAADLTNLKCWYSSDATFNAGSDVLLSTKTTSLGAGAQVFPSFSTQSITSSTTGYIFITTDITLTATPTNTILVDAITTADISFVSGNKSGSANASGTKTIIDCTPTNATGVTATSGNAQATVAFTVPSCYDEIMVVAKPTTTIGASPSGNGSGYTANLAFGTGGATAFDGTGYVVYKGATSSQIVTGLSNGTQYYFKLFTRRGTVWSAGIEVNATPTNLTTGDFRSNVTTGNWNTAGSWQTWNGSAWVVASAAPTSSSTANNVTVRSGHTITLTAGGVACNSLTVESTGKLFANNATNRYIDILGNMICDGTIGNGSTADGISFNIEGSSCLISGSGAFDCSRIRKSSTTNATSTLTISMNVNARYNGTAVYSNIAAATFNVIISSGSTLSCPGDGTANSNGAVSIDGIDGAGSGERGGTLTVNGTLTISGIGTSQPLLYAKTSNTTSAVALSIGATGIVNTPAIDFGASGAGGHTFTIGSGGVLNITSQPTSFVTPSNTNNTYTFNANSNINYNRSGDQTIYTFGSSVNQGNITLSGSGVKSVPSTGIINVAGTLTTGGLLTLKSDATGTASIGNSAGTISGNVNVERYISGSGRRYRFLSSPVSAATISNWMDSIWVTGPGDSVIANRVNGSTLGTANTNGWHTSIANINYPTSGGDIKSVKYTSIRTYDETATSNNSNIDSGFANVSTSQSLTPGQGFKVFVRGPRKVGGIDQLNQLGATGSFPSQNAVTLSLTGTVNQGDIVLNGSTNTAYKISKNTQGWNLIGNPYPCAYNLVAHYTGNSNSLGSNLNTTIYIYNATTGGYHSYNANGGTAVGSGLSAGIIPSGSAFFIQASSASPVFTFKETYKTSTAPGVLHKTDVKTDQFEIKYYKDSVESDYLTVKVYDGATSDYDTYDIFKLRNDNLNLSAYGQDTVQLAATVIPPVTEETHIKLNVEARAIGTYKFDFINMDNFDKGVTVSLFDRYTNKTTNIGANSIYTFDMGPGLNQWGKNRFELILNGKATSTNPEDKQSTIINTKMSVYPNPASDVLNISINNASFKNSSISIFNISGNEVLNTAMIGASTQLNIESLSNGVYFVKVKNENGFDRTVKFIK